MKITCYDEYGKPYVFNTNNCKEFEEDTRWNGHNEISLATGTQFDHETLYRTKKGTWVLLSWSQWQGSAEEYEIIDKTTAIHWLLKNNYHEYLEKNFSQELQQLEV
jgi:hypothetical protein